MDGLIHAAVEAEEILKRAKHGSVDLTNLESGVVDHKMTWIHDKMHISETVDESRTKFHRNTLGSKSHKVPEKFDLFKKLHELYNEINRDELLQNNYQGLRITSHLLEKMLAIYNLNTLVINLYPGNKGYSLSLKVNGNAQVINPPDGSFTIQDENLIETPCWPYEEEELLSYIDNEELPLILMDLLEAEHSCLFYSGCIIAQIRDYRQAYPSFVCDTHHVLLRPTTQSLLTDSTSICSRFGWTGDDRAAFESAFVLATAPPLCLDPRPAVGLLAARLHSAPRLFNTPRIRRQARRFSQVAVNRKRKLDQFTHHHGLELLELIHRQRAKNSRQSVPHTRLSSKYPKKPPETFKSIEPPKMDPPPLVLPADVSAPLKLARAYERPRPSPDCQPQLVEEYILETEKNSSHGGSGFFHIKLSILQRPSDQEFLGELYVDRDHVEGERNGAACRFTLGTRVQANKYIQQFTEIFTEEGRKSVRITHVVPGQVPRVSYTAGMRETQRAAAANNASVQAHATTVPIVTSSITATPNTHNNARSLPILTQLQCAGVSTVGAVPGTSEPLKQPLPSPSTQRLSPQVHDIHSSQNSTNQLLTQQLTNPPQPLNPQKLQQAIIHIQHPLMSTAGTSQVQTLQYTNASAPQPKSTLTKPRTTNAAISALVTSLMNSAHQFQQAASQKAATSTTNNNATILNLLNSTPTMTPGSPAPSNISASSLEKALLSRTVSLAGARLIATVTTTSQTLPTYSHQVMGGYSCEETSSAVTNNDSGLLERLMAGDTADSDSNNQHTVQPQPQAVHLQGVSLASLSGLQQLSSLQSLQGVQNVQVQIPGIAQPISLQLNVSAPSGLLVSVPPTTSVVLANQPTALSLPIGSVRGGVQLVRGRAPQPRPAAPASLHAAGTQLAGTQFISQTATVATHQLRRKSNADNS